MHIQNVSHFAANAVISRALLTDAAARVCKVTEKRATIPVLANLHLVGSGGGLAVTGTDLDMWHTVTVQAAADSRFDVTVPAHMFKDVLKKQKGEMVAASYDAKITPPAQDAPEGAEPTVEVSPLALDCEGPDIRLNTLPANDFPDAPAFEVQASFEIGMRDLFDAFDSTRFAISTEETRYYLNGVFLHVVHNHETGADELRFVATDGHRLALATLAAPDGLDFSGLPNNNGPRGVIIPRKAIATVMGELSALLAAHKKAKTEPGRVTVSVAGRFVRFAFADASLTTKAIDGTFPDYARVIPQQLDKSAEFATKDALATIAAVSCIASERGRAVKLTFDSSGVEFLVTNPDAGSAKDKIAATFTAVAPEANPTFEIGMNSAYLAECLEESRAETVCLRMAEAGSPVRMESRFGNVAWLSILMPMRV